MRSPASTSGAAGLLAAATLDGLPENVALGVSLGDGTGGLAPGHRLNVPGRQGLHPAARGYPTCVVETRRHQT